MVYLKYLCCVVLLLLMGCRSQPEPLFHQQSYVFGTLVELSVYGVPEPQAKQAMQQVLLELDRLHHKLHAWQPSELSRLNAALATGQSVTVDDELRDVLLDAQQWSHTTEELFNPAMGGLIRLWGFQADEFAEQVPAANQVAALLNQGASMADINIADNMVSSVNAAVQLDLGGYAKGYALDRAVVLLRQQGITQALVNIGGNIIALGQRGGRPWRVGIQHPRKPGALAAIELRDGEAIGTSGDYQRFFMVGSQRYCHLIDPRSGYPAQGVQAVTVITAGKQAGVKSDVLSKPLFLAGATQWQTWARRLELAAVMRIAADGQVYVTPALKQRMELLDKTARLHVVAN